MKSNVTRHWNPRREKANIYKGSETSNEHQGKTSVEQPRAHKITYDGLNPCLHETSCSNNRSEAQDADFACHSFELSTREIGIRNVSMGMGTKTRCLHDKKSGCHASCVWMRIHMRISLNTKFFVQDKIAEARQANTWQHIASLTEASKMERALGWQKMFASEMNCAQMLKVKVWFEAARCTNLSYIC